VVTEAEMERRARFEALFREHVPGIASYCRWQLRSPGDVDDAVAEVFLVAWRRLADVPVGEAARPWLYGTARRVVANQARSQARRSRLQERLSVQPRAVRCEDDPVADRVRDALAALGPRDREVLLLAEWEGLAPAEIAGVMRCPAVTVRGRLHRARHRFRAAFEPEDRADRARSSPVAAGVSDERGRRAHKPRTFCVKENDDAG
jgi:RNA polymerase sigma-70 factor, ECF subfamily